MVQGGFLSGEKRAHLEALVRRQTTVASVVSPVAV